MFFAAALLAFAPLVFLALSAHAQGNVTTYSIVNTATGLVFEDHDWVPVQFGNPIVGAPHTGLPEQSWEVVLAPGFAVRFKRERLVGRQRIFVGTDGHPFPGAELKAQRAGDAFVFSAPFGTANGIFAFTPFYAPNLAITAPSVANGTLTLQPYNATDQYQHWVFVAPGTPQLSFSAGKKEEDEEESPKL